MSAFSTIPLFPLHTVLFPGNLLPLRIFEPRYVDMVGDCMRGSSPFGVVLIRHGSETGAPAQTVDVGSLAEIIDFNQGDDGMLHITARAGPRFRILSRRIEPDALQIAEIEMFADEQPMAVPERHQRLVQLLSTIYERIGSGDEEGPARMDDSAWLGFRLATLLPLPLAAKQAVLETRGAIARLDKLAALLSAD